MAGINGFGNNYNNYGNFGNYNNNNQKNVGNEKNLLGNEVKLNNQQGDGFVKSGGATPDSLGQTGWFGDVVGIIGGTILGVATGAAARVACACSTVATALSKAYDAVLEKVINDPVGANEGRDNPGSWAPGRPTR